MARRRRSAALSPEDRAVVEIMSNFDLKPGQMLLFGPKSVRIITTAGAYDGRLPDKFIFEREEWNK